jgi:hypothetical protein
MTKRTILEMAREAGFAVNVSTDPNSPPFWWAAGHNDRFEAFAKLVRDDERNRTWTQQHWTDYERSIAAAEREAIYELVMEAPFKEFDRQEEEFDGEAANAMKAMAFSLTSAIRARSGEQA